MKIIKITAIILVISLLTAFFAGYPFGGDDTDADPENGSNDVGSGSASVTDFSEFASNTAILTNDAITVSAKSAILCTSDGLVIFEKQADVPLPMASITKVMSAVIALESIENVTDKVTVSGEAVGVEGSSVYLKTGECVDFEMLLYSTMLESANDATLALAIAVSGSEEAFVTEMNRKAKELHMDSTCFKNPHGLSEDGHYTTARDYAKLMAYALQNKQFCEIISTKKKVLTADDGSFTRVLTNHNRLLNTYKGMLGGKTGFTKSSGRTLVTAAERDGTTLICVTINASDDWNDHTNLFDLGFDTVKTENITPEKFPVKVRLAGGFSEYATAEFEAFSLTVLKEDEITVEITVPHFVFAPAEKGREIGKVDCLVNGIPKREAVIYLNEDCQSSVKETGDGGVFEKIIDFFKK